MPTCRQCGRCCSEKVIVGDQVFLTPYFCPYLDPRTRRCTIYDRRHQLVPDCLSVEQAIKARAFPADCPYVRTLPGYRPPREDWWNHPEVRELVEQGGLEGTRIPDDNTKNHD